MNGEPASSFRWTGPPITVPIAIPQFRADSTSHLSPIHGWALGRGGSLYSLEFGTVSVAST